MEHITPQELHAVLQKNDADVCCVDIRESFERQSGYIEQSRHIPMGEIGEYLDELVSYKAVYIICQSGSRSQIVCEALSAHGVHAVNVSGGLIAWRLQFLPMA